MNGLFNYGILSILLLFLRLNEDLELQSCLCVNPEENVVADVLIEPAQLWRIGRLEQMQLLEKLRRFIRHTFDAEVFQQKKLRQKQQDTNAVYTTITRLNPLSSAGVNSADMKYTGAPNRFQQLKLFSQSNPGLTRQASLTSSIAIPGYVQPISNVAQKFMSEPFRHRFTERYFHNGIVEKGKKMSRSTNAIPKHLTPIDPFNHDYHPSILMTLKTLRQRRKTSNRRLPDGPLSLFK